MTRALRSGATLALAMLSVCAPSLAQAKQTVKLTATLTPEHLGEGTTVGFNFRVVSPPGHVPSPAVVVDLRYPNDLGIALSGLGIETCRLAALEVFGLAACPADSRMGSGNATMEIQLGPEIVRERADIAVLRAPVKEGRFALIFYANGASPVEAQLALPAFLLTATEPFGGRVDIHVPLVPSLPESPDIALTHLQWTLGPGDLTYYERLHGQTISYVPRGIQLPKSCPRGGFPFAATFAFLDGAHTTARTSVPCPK